MGGRSSLLGACIGAILINTSGAVLTNTGDSTNINQASSLSNGTATLTVRGPDSAVVYSASLANNGTFHSWTNQWVWNVTRLSLPTPVPFACQPRYDLVNAVPGFVGSTLPMLLSKSHKGPKCSFRSRSCMIAIPVNVLVIEAQWKIVSASTGRRVSRTWACASGDRSAW